MLPVLLLFAALLLPLLSLALMCMYTVKLRYNGLIYNVSSVIEYAFSRSRHFSIQNVSVSTYLDITYRRLLQTDFWAQTLQWTPASMYVHTPSSQLTSVNNVSTGGATLMLSACHPVSGQGCWLLLTAANAWEIPLLRWFMRASANQSAFQLCAIKETISSFDYTIWFERRYSWWHVNACNF